MILIIDKYRYLIDLIDNESQSLNKYQFLFRKLPIYNIMYYTYINQDLLDN